MAGAQGDSASKTAASVDLEELLATRGERLLRSAYLLCGDASEAQDLVQETLLQALESAHQLQWGSFWSIRDLDLRAHELDLIGRAGGHQVVDGESAGGSVPAGVSVQQVGTVGEPIAANGRGQAIQAVRHR